MCYTILLNENVMMSLRFYIFWASMKLALKILNFITLFYSQEKYILNNEFTNLFQCAADKSMNKCILM